MTLPILRTPLRDDLTERCKRGRVVVIDDDPDVLDAFCNLIRDEGYACETYPSARAYLQAVEFSRPLHPGPSCVLSDVKMPEMDGLQLQEKLNQLGDVPMILMSGDSGVREAVTGMKAGATDFLVKPVDADQLLDALARALKLSQRRQHDAKRHKDVSERLGQLSRRELEVAHLVARGMTSVGISLELGITVRTVKFHRQRILHKLSISGTPELVRLLEETRPLLAG